MIVDWTDNQYYVYGFTWTEGAVFPDVSLTSACSRTVADRLRTLIVPDRTRSLEAPSRKRTIDVEC